MIIKMAAVKGSLSVCDFCGRGSNDLLYGPIHRRKDVKCHYFCLLFSSNLDQNGKDDEGILGFLLQDIRKDLRRAKTVKCSYCLKPGGVSVCHAIKCRRKFHLPCGLERGSLHLFFDDFRSYCGEHRRKQKVPADILSRKDVNCSICFDPVEDLTSIDSLWAPCCKKNGWFHRLCIQKFALNAAYFFKCPLCASQGKFRDAMLRNGIYIPDQDASWELEPNAFAELLERHEQCDAASCKCPKGRKFSSENSRFWNLILCRNCGSRGIHVGCIPGPKSSLDRRSVWDCSDCNVIIQGKRNSLGQDAAASIGYHVKDEDDDDDEIIVVDDDVEVCDNTCDKNRGVSNIGLRNPDIQHILSNVIHLKNTAVDVIDLVNDENEVELEKLNDDDEMHGPMDECGSNKDEPIISEIKKESCMEMRNEVGEELPLYPAKPIGFSGGEDNPQQWQKLYSGGGEGIFDGEFWGSSFDHNSNSSVYHSNYSIYPSHHFGLKLPSTKWKRYPCYRSRSNCLKCFRRMETKAGNLYNNLLFDGWHEILHCPSKFPSTGDRHCCKDIRKLYWVRKARWICGLTSFLSDLRQSSAENQHDCLMNPNLRISRKIKNDWFYGLDKMVQPSNFSNSYPEITVQFLN